MAACTDDLRHTELDGAVTMFLHIMPRVAAEHRHGGVAKDVISRVLWLREHVHGYRQVVVDCDAPTALAELWAKESIDGALVEYTSYPRIVHWLKSRCHLGCVAVRAHNLEPLQHLQNNGWWPRRGPLWVLYGMWRLLLQDTRCKHDADVILSINDWENRVYWSRLPGRAKIEWLPYYCPDHLVPRHPLPYSQRRVIACMPASEKHRRTRDVVMQFLAFASAMKAAGSGYEYVVTGDLADWGLPGCPYVAYTGFVNDLAEFMGQCRAAAVLSPLGYGFKTTAGDAMAAGARVLVHPELLRRCGTPPGSAALAVDTDRLDPAAVDRWLQMPQSTAPESVHHDLRQRNHAVLSRWIAGSMESSV